ncbi:hypothetical protein [Gulosibacter faecalis]|jgi:hypothetical protein|uniref:Uncharacterized protein n=1 Tax=Gulosibacter faecalis TaxID=272240 RepID=A0ABW5UVL7_9MICO|nr:hypothetical protein [Gulosibacter faecalis]
MSRGQRIAAVVAVVVAAAGLAFAITFGIAMLAGGGPATITRLETAVQMCDAPDDPYLAPQVELRDDGRVLEFTPTAEFDDEVLIDSMWHCLKSQSGLSDDYEPGEVEHGVRVSEIDPDDGTFTIEIVDE